MEIISNSEKETIELGKKIASKLYKGLIIILTGDLGAGKTKFTEGFLKYRYARIEDMEEGLIGDYLLASCAAHPFLKRKGDIL